MDTVQCLVMISRQVRAMRIGHLRVTLPLFQYESEFDLYEIQPEDKLSHMKVCREKRPILLGTFSLHQS